GEAESLALLGRLGVPVPATVVVHDADAAAKADGSMGFPVVLKTASAAHKSDVGGFRLGLGSERAVSEAYAELAGRLGAAAAGAAARAARGGGGRGIAPRPP